MQKYIKRSIIIIVIIIIVIIIRLSMSYALLHYVEYRLNQIPNYRASIAALDLHLYRGSYVIKGVKLEKITRGAPVPFFSADSVDLAIEWRPLFHGSLVGQIKLEHPNLNFVVDPSKRHEQLTISSAWQDAVKAIFPLNFNKISISDGEVHYRSFTSDPPFNIYIDQIQATVDNLRNVTQSQQTLSSTLQLQGRSIGGAQVNISVKFNPFTKEPTFDLTAEAKQMDLSKANDFLKHYTKLKVTSGIFSVYIEAAANRGKIIGYVKPLIKNLKIADETPKNPAQAVYKAAAKVVSKVLENPRTKMIATKVTISGRITDPNVSVWSLVVSILRNAFIQALLPQIDQNIEFKDILIRS